MNGQWVPIRGYRYVSPEDERFLDDASFKLNTLSALREMEWVLADRTEGTLTWTIDNPRVYPWDDRDTSKMHPQIAEFYNMAKNPNAFIRHCTVILRSEERFIYCLSRKYANRHLIEKGLTERYEILDVVRFGDYLRQDSAGVLNGMKIGRINYDLRYKNNFDNIVYHNDEYEKDVKFFSERELRISFRINPDFHAEPCTIIKSERARSLMKKIS